VLCVCLMLLYGAKKSSCGARERASRLWSDRMGRIIMRESRCSVSYRCGLLSACIFCGVSLIAHFLERHRWGFIFFYKRGLGVSCGSFFYNSSVKKL